MTEESSITVAILRDIRDEMIKTRIELSGRIDQLGDRIDRTRTELGERIDRVEGAVLEVAEQQRFVVRHLRVLTTRDRTIEADVDRIDADVESLRERVDTIEKRLPPTR